ncbi:MAG TPA: Rieske (2Fe-2S) protein [Gemmatimonadaceae bacterium]|jgi:nitrite reductase/ring-hydroxylating ferredoxin subunit
MIRHSATDRAECRGCDETQRPGLSGELAASAPDAIGRRTFLVQTAILAAGAALVACGAAGADATAPNVPANSSIRVSDYPSLSSVGGVAMVSLGGAPVAIVRTGASSYIALSRVCPHQGGTVGQSGNEFVCPVHGAQFDLSGNWIGGQPTSSLHQYATSFDAASGTLSIS